MLERGGWLSVLGVCLAVQVFILNPLARSGDATALPVPNGPRTLGPFGPEGTRLREQLWLVPGSAQTPLRATLFRPDGPPDAKFPLVILNHGTDARTREAVSMPVFYWLSRWFVDRGFAVILPQRRGHGATGGPLAEGFDTCVAPDHVQAGHVAADDIAGVFEFMKQQPFVDPQRIVVAGVSTGGWAALAFAARNPDGLAAVVNFAGGRGAYAGGRAGAICAKEKLIDAAALFGKNAKIPTLWLYASNDSYFGPELARRMSGAWRASGGTADLKILPPHGAEGHALADDRDGWEAWGRDLSTFLKTDPGAER